MGISATHLFDPLLLHRLQSYDSSNASGVNAKCSTNSRNIHTSLDDLTMELFPQVLAQDTLGSEVLV